MRLFIRVRFCVKMYCPRLSYRLVKQLDDSVFRVNNCIAFWLVRIRLQQKFRRGDAAPLLGMPTFSYPRNYPILSYDRLVS